MKLFSLVALFLLCVSQVSAGDCNYSPSYSYRSYSPSYSYRSYSPSYSYSRSYSPSLSWRYYRAGTYDGIYWDTDGYYAWSNGHWYRQGYGICDGVPAPAQVVVVQSALGLTLDDVERIVARRIAEATTPKPPMPKATSGLTAADVERLVAKRLAELADK